MGKVIEPLTIEMMFANFSKILKAGGQHLSIRKAVIAAICKQISNFSEKKDFQKIAPSLQAFLAELTRNELDQILKNITEIYLEQRKIIKGGDREIKVNGNSYQIWFNSKRPYTEIEKILMQWLGDEEYPIAQQFAMQAQVNFVIALDKQEDTIIEQIRKEQITDEGNNEEFNTLETVKPRSFILDNFIAAFATLFAESHRPIVRNVLPEAFEQNKSRRDVIDFILNRWQYYTNKEDKIGGRFKFVTTSNRLRFGLWLAKNRLWLIICLIVLSGFFSVIIINYIVSSSIQSTQKVITKEQALTLIDQYLQEKDKMFGPNHNMEPAERLATGEFYQQLTKPGGHIDALKQKNQYYQYIVRKKTKLLRDVYYNSYQAEIDVNINEKAKLYENDIYKKTETYDINYRFSLKKENGTWKIADTEQIQP
ncbi:MAG: ARC6/PARC6 family protein [Nostoc sp. DcaGUA01]|nr:ARC6/PARC6 family protein [Nostoc sp. DcaGUA01]